MKLIIIENEIATLDVETSAKIAEFERQLKVIKEQEDELRQAILNEMEEKNIIKLETDDLVITYVAPTDRETLDSKSLKADMPEIYDEYVKISPVKSSIRIKVRDKKEENKEEDIIRGFIA